MLQNILFFSLKKSLLHNIVQSIQNMVFLPTMPFNWYLLTMYEAPTVELGVTADPKGSITSWRKRKLDRPLDLNILSVAYTCSSQVLVPAWSNEKLM